MSSAPDEAFSKLEAAPILDACTRIRLGRQLQALYNQVLDEGLDMRLTALLQQLDQDDPAPESV